MRRPHVVLVASVLFSALALACKPSGESRDDSPPVGSYGIELPPMDSTSGAATERWILALAEGGRFTVSRQGEQAVAGEYRIAADTIVFSGESGTLACPDSATGPGIYLWRRGERDLTLTPVIDRCDGRRATFGVRPLVRETTAAP